MLSILVFAIGASVGSFLNVVADRLPMGGSLISPRSYCPSCKRSLPNLELVPILSYLWLRGRCRTCGESIPLRIVLVETVTALLFAAVYLRFGLTLEFLILSAAVSLLIVVAVIDIEHGLILNRIVLPSVAVLLVLAPFWPQMDVPRPFLGSAGMVASMANSLAAGGGAFLIFLVIGLAYPQGMGGGDVKLAGLVGLLVGFPGVLVALWGAVVSGGVVAISLLVLGKKGRKDAIPFGPFLSLGGIAVLLAGVDIIAGYQSLLDKVAGL